MPEPTQEHQLKQPPPNLSDQTNRVERPWGWFESLGSGGGYQVKRLLVRAGNRISLQLHNHRREHWIVVAGEGSLECDGIAIPAQAGTCLAIPLGAIHRASASGADLVIVEVQEGDWLSEDDIERLSDDYGRVVA
jgi:mannose-6-phosphate isomerase-like protein (cupin superfamily)